MAEVTYFVALPFIATDDEIAAGEPIECFNMVGGIIPECWAASPGIRTKTSAVRHAQSRQSPPPPLQPCRSVGHVTKAGQFQ
jgi:hypothetical protein